MDEYSSPDHLERKLKVHSNLDHVFMESCDIDRLPATISYVGSHFLNCEFISIWPYNPEENVLENLVARGDPDSGLGRGANLPVGKARVKIEKGPGVGIMPNLAALILEGIDIRSLPEDQYIVNDRNKDPRSRIAKKIVDGTPITSTMYAPMVFNGFKGMMLALNHKEHRFAPADYEILEILARKAAIVIDNLQVRRKFAEASRLAAMGRAVDLVRHELKSPLTVIKTASYTIQMILKKGILTEEERENLQQLSKMMIEEVDRNTRMLEEIRLYCAPEMRLELVRGDINKFLRQRFEEIRTFAFSCNRGDVELRMNLGSESFEVDLSPDHILGALRNLVRNSLEHRSPVVEIATEPCEIASPEGPKTAVAVSVADRGGGVDEGLLESIFSPYETSRWRMGGSGLGLFITRRIVKEGHGGVLLARNIYEGERRAGLRIEIRLPLATA